MRISGGGVYGREDYIGVVQSASPSHRTGHDHAYFLPTFLFISPPGPTEADQVSGEISKQAPERTDDGWRQAGPVPPRE